MSSSIARSNGHCPLVLAIGGHDPSGAGIHADIETCAALGCMAVSIVTALTTQNTASVFKVTPVDPEEIRDQILTILQEFEIAACKIGLVPTAAISQMLAELLTHELDGRPIVVDPVMRAGSGDSLALDDMRDPLMAELIPHAELLTPNASEVEVLTNCSDLENGISKIHQSGCQAVLVTDAGNDRDLIVNRLYLRDTAPEDFEMKRFGGSYHGTGCTLASASACKLAQGLPLRACVAQAQEFVHGAVVNAHQFGASQAIPNRFTSRTP